MNYMSVLQFYFYFCFICYSYDIGEENSDFYSFLAERNFKKILYNEAYALPSSGFFF
jgi:hypothetical protein